MTSALPQSLPHHPDAEAALGALCKAAADGLRLRILRLLRQDAMGVGELCAVLDVRQPALSHHLKLMSSAGLLSSQRDGNHIFYRRREIVQGDNLADLREALFAAADALPMDAEIRQRCENLQRRRENNSRDFFRSHAGHFREQQDLIAAPDVYAGAVTRLIETLSGPRACAVEVGPGEGWLLPELATRFDRVIALDNAPRMLEAAQHTAAGAKNIDYILGDTRHDALEADLADLVVINMVLHHTPQPRAMLADAARMLRPGGHLLITELCEHRQGWARENCGDLWLGFRPEELTAWAADAGLEERSSTYLGQRNGFKLQLRLFAGANTSDKR